jgi:hypothetical protein
MYRFAHLKKTIGRKMHLIVTDILRTRPWSRSTTTSWRATDSTQASRACATRYQFHESPILGENIFQTKVVFFGGGSNPLCFSSSLADYSFLLIILFGSTTLLTWMTGISLHHAMTSDVPVPWQWQKFLFIFGPAQVLRLCMSRTIRVTESQWVIVYSGQLFENYRNSPNFWTTFSRRECI